jgi:antitoxin component YwqK of YwqJK toxin-antitoxin module
LTGQKEKEKDKRPESVSKKANNKNLYHMKIFSGSLLIIVTLSFLSGCNGKSGVKKESLVVADTISVPDTGYTGIKKYMSGQILVKEVTFKNGVREGLMKSFYQTGQLRQTFWYRNGLREDSAIWYYMEGQVFRSTPYLHDTIEGTQRQYYRNGRLKAKIGYLKGLRTPYFEEFTMDGKLVSGYPQLVVSIQDEYRSRGVYKIILKLTDRSTRVRFYRGDFSGGVFDTAQCKKINMIKGSGYINLKKTGSQKTAYIGVIAEVLTNFGNNYLVYKKIDLPYNDLK